jgi:hypothetical protein
MVELPRITIILVNWNGREDTLACLRSLGDIDYPQERRRIILVDNASSDGSVEAVRSAFPDVTLIENDANMRFAHANNQGIALALEGGADAVLLLNNDTEVNPSFLRRMAEALIEGANVGIVGAKVYFYEPSDLLWYAGGVVSMWRGLIAHQGIREPDRGQYDTRRDTGYVTACCALASRACVEAVGGLDERYYIYGEDADWSERARRAGFRVVVEPAARVWHKVSSSSGGRDVAGGLTPFKVIHKIRSMVRFFRTHARWYHWTTIPLFALWYGLKAAVMMVATGNWAALRAMGSAFSRRRS